MTQEHRPLSPLYMWAGGKTKMLKHYNPLLPAPDHYSRYVEPFFGGGALYCQIMNNNQHVQAVINDSNSEMMGIYRSIQQDVDSFISTYQEHVHHYFSIPYNGDNTLRKKWYYAQREEYWSNPSPELLLLLMKTGFNGIWQTCAASGGLFGTPAGLLNHKRVEQLYSPDLLRSWSQALERTTIMSGDYLEVEVAEGDFVFLDPPYRGSFTSYGTGYDDDNQRELCEWMRGSAASVVWMSNREVDEDQFFEDLLGGEFDLHYFPVTYTAGRRKRTESGFEAMKAREFLAVRK